jgi:hypothetical protein
MSPFLRPAVAPSCRLASTPLSLSHLLPPLPCRRGTVGSQRGSAAGAAAPSPDAAAETAITKTATAAFDLHPRCLSDAQKLLTPYCTTLCFLLLVHHWIISLEGNTFLAALLQHWMDIFCAFSPILHTFSSWVTTWFCSNPTEVNARI